MFHFLSCALHRFNLVFFLSSGMNAILPTRDPSMPMPLSKACGALTKSSDELSSGLRCLETTRLRVYRVSGGRYLYRGQSLRSCCVRMQLGRYLFLDFLYSCLALAWMIPNHVPTTDTSIKYYFAAITMLQILCSMVSKRFVRSFLSSESSYLPVAT